MSAELMKSKFARRPSLRRPCRYNARIFSHFSCYFPGPYIWIFFFFLLIFEKKNPHYPIFSSAWLCQQRSWYGRFVRRPSSVVRPWSQLYLFLMCGFLSNLGCCFPWAIPPDVFGIFEKKIFSCLDCLGIFFVFGKMEPYASKNFKTLLLQIAAETFQTSPEYSSQWSSQNTTFGIFKILKIEILMIFFFAFVNMGPNRSENFKNATPSTDRSRKLSNLSWIFLPVVLTKLRLGVWNFEFFNVFFFLLLLFFIVVIVVVLLLLFFRKFQIPHCTLWKNQKPIWSLRHICVMFGSYMCNFWNFGHFPSFMPKYGNFENWPVSWKSLPVEQK